MAVIDHPVHESTKHTDATLHAACKAKVRADGYYVLTRHYFEDGMYWLENKWIEDALSKACRNVDYATTPACDGCRQPKDETYIQEMKGL